MCILSAVVALLAAVVATAASTGRPAVVRWSDGAEARGNVSITPGWMLRLNAGGAWHDLDVSRVQAIRLSPASESMERKWGFREAGKTAKEVWGAPYPVRELEARVFLADGSSQAGHLMTTVFYIEDGETTRKAILAAKQRGTEGQSLTDLVYPVSLTFTDDADPAPDLTRPVPTNVVEFAALCGPSLLRYAVGKDATSLRYPAATPTFLASAAADGRIAVEWPTAAASPDLKQRIAAALPDVRDFFEDRRLLGVCQAGKDLYALLLLRRDGRTTLGADKSQPWRLEVWRWKAGNDDKLLIAARGWFFRGIEETSAAPPDVRLMSPME